MNKQLVFQAVSFLSGPVLCYIVQQIPAPEGMTQAGMLNMGACLWLVAWWMTEVFPLPVTAVLSIPIFGLLGLLPPVKAFSFLGSSTCMLIFGATILVGLIKESGLIQRYAYWMMSRPCLRRRPMAMIFSFALGIGALSAVAPNIPVAMLFAAATVALGRSCHMQPQNRMMRGLCVLNGVATSIGGIGTPLGGAPNMVVIALIASVLHHEVTFWEWSALGLPLALLSLVVVGLLAGFFFIRKEYTSLSTEFMEKKLRELGPMTRYELISLVIIAVALFLWCFGPMMARAVGWKEGVKLLGGPIVAIFMGAACFLVPRGDRGEGRLRFAMNWKQAKENISWEILVITMGILAFGEVLLDGGVDKWCALVIQNLLGDVHGASVWFFLILFTCLCSQFVTNIALASLVIPLTANLAAVYGFNALAACVSVGMVSNVAVMFTFSSVTPAVAIMGAEEYSHPRDFMKFGFLVTIIISSIVYVLSYVFGGMIFHVAA